MADAKKEAAKVELHEQIEHMLRQATNTPPDRELPEPVINCWTKWKGHHDRIVGGGLVIPAPQVVASILLSANLLEKMDRIAGMISELTPKR